MEEKQQEKHSKLYVFGDMIAESYLVKKERHGYNLYEQNTQLKIIPAGTRIITDFASYFKQAAEGKVFHETYKNSFFARKKLEVLPLKHAALRSDGDKEDEIDLKKEKDANAQCCPYSYSTLCKKRTSLSEKPVYLIHAGDGYERNFNSLSYPDVSADEFKLCDDDVVILHDKGLAFSHAFRGVSYEQLMNQDKGSEKSLIHDKQTPTSAEKAHKKLWGEKCALIDKYMSEVFSKNHSAKILVYCSEMHLEDFLERLSEYVDAIDDETLREKKRNSITILLFMDSIRRRNVMISKRLSWEKTAYDFWKAFKFNENIRALRSFKNVVAFTDMEGALLYQADPTFSDNDSPLCKERQRFRLLFTPEKIEGDIMNRNVDYVEDIEEVLTLSFALACHNDCDPCDCARFALHMIQKSYVYGVLCMNDLLKEYLSFTVDPKKDGNNSFTNSSYRSLPMIELPFTYAQDENFCLDENWSILNEKYPSENKADASETAMNKAIDIVKYGSEKVFSQIPLLKINKLEAINRREIESFRSIKLTMEQYLANPERSNPISIAVFGSPGSGKSFGIKQIIGQLKEKNPQLNVIETNVSQYKKVEDLEMQFEQIRNDAVRGKLPIVFFDEFDSDFNDVKWGWIKYFLAPMQDGLYIHNGITNYLGRSIFIFAGATVFSYEELIENITETSDPNGSQDKAKNGNFPKTCFTEESKKMKVPDFLSRLKGYLNIISINNEEGNGDQSYLIKRALIFRDMLTRYGKNMISTKEYKENGKSLKKLKANIDNNLLKTLLEIPLYRYGSRSLEQIIQMSELKNEFHFTPSMLPSKEQLMMHIEESGEANFYQKLNSIKGSNQ